MNNQLRFCTALLLVFASSAGFSAPDTNADLDGDAVVNILDISLLARCFGHDLTNDCTKADVDEDGDIDREDLYFVSERIGQAYPSILYPLPSSGNSNEVVHQSTLTDVNGDGRLDLIVLKTKAEGSLSVQLGSGDGSFQEGRYYAQEISATTMVVGDINGDSRVDLILGSQTDGDVAIVLGNGDGSFQTPENIISRGHYTSTLDLALGDVNKDGATDLLVNMGYYSSPSLYLGNGDGSFQEPLHPETSYGPRGALLDDLNGDDTLDLVIVGTKNVSVLLGTGDGTFQTPQTLAMSNFTSSSELLGDVSGDGELDLILNSRDEARILLGNGDGTFQDPLTFNDPVNYIKMAVDDLNSDGILDMVFPNAQEDKISVFLSQGNGNFAAQQDYRLKDDPDFVSLGDVDGDGNPDVVLSSRYEDGATVLLGDGSGNYQEFENAHRFNLLTDSLSTAFGDVNGDGTNDLIAIGDMKNPGGETAQGCVLVALIEDGVIQNQQCYAAEPFDQSGFGNIVTLEDVNGDNKLDIIYSQNGFFVLLGNGDGTFQERQYRDGNGRPLINVDYTLGDINGDNQLDIVATLESHGNLALFLGNGNGSFQAPAYYGGGMWPLSVKLGDMNGDDILDVVIADGDSYEVLIYLGNGDGTLQEPQTFEAGAPPYGASPHEIHLGDVNGDGSLDVVATNYNSISLLLGNGDGALQEEQRYDFSNSNGPLSAKLADINQDGILDIVTLIGYETNDIGILPINSDGTFMEMKRIVGSFPANSFSLGDVNGDGLDDIVNFGAYVGLWLANGDGSFQQQQRFYAVNGEGKLNDFNGDGKLDTISLGTDVSILLNQSHNK